MTRKGGSERKHNDIPKDESALEIAETEERVKASFLANISHEIRTPMNAIKNMSDLLLLTGLDDTQRGYAQGISNAAHSLLAIINDLLDFSKIEADKLELLEAPVDLGSLLSDIAGLINLKASEKELDFISDISPKSPSSVICDEIRLKQVLLSLLTNAVKFTAKGHVRFIMECKPAKGDKVRLTFTVSDTGMGIKEDDLSTIFHPFTQAGMYLDPNVEGTGLGLPISSKLVEKMGGRMECESVFGMGSSFHFSIEVRASSSESLANVISPLAKRVLVIAGGLYSEQYENMLSALGVNYDIAPDEETCEFLIDENFYTHLLYKYDCGHSVVMRHIDRISGNCQLVAIKDIKLASRQNTGANIRVLFEPVLVMSIAQVLNNKKAITTEPVANGNDKDIIGFFKFQDAKILIVDDNDINLMVASELLRQYGIEPDTADGAASAFKLLEERRYDIIFMDHMMPEINGIEATRILRDKGGWLTSAPIIALTANALSGMKETYLSCGMSDYISKPIEISELNRVLITWLPKEKITVSDAPALRRFASKNAIIERLAGKLDAEGAIIGIGGSESAYLNVVRAFLSTLPEKTEAMRRQIETGEYEQFRIGIHATKSSLANIGAKDLSGDAKNLELAAHSYDYNYIDGNFEQFCRSMDELFPFIEWALSADAPETSESKIQGSAAELRTMLERTDALLEVLEQDEAIDILEKAISKSYGEYLDRNLLQIRAAIESFNYDSASGMIRLILSTGELSESTGG
ncbi:MAG: response regulator [Synergistaceae bacterium]|jgi:CheY-like chemotaxis protein|nr:response regulator [Synergistaceae bacterium]